MTRSRIRLPVLGMCLVLIASCGGGSGTTMNPPPPPPNPAALPITTANADIVTASVLQAVIATGDFVDILEFIGAPVLVGGPGINKLPFADIDVQVRACDTGEVTVTWDDADNDGVISTGDTIELFFNSCFIAQTGETLDGTAMIDPIVVTGDPFNQIPHWRLITGFTFDALMSSGAGSTATIDGDLELDISSNDNVIVQLLVTANSLTAALDGVSETLSNYSLYHFVNVGTLRREIEADGTLTSTLLEGSVDFDTVTPFVVFADDYPSSGQMLITEATSSVRVMVLSNINVQLQIDLNNNGTIDETIVVTWAELGID